MAYFEVKLNGIVLARAGAADITVLDAHVIVTARGVASLGVGGMRMTANAREHFGWVSQRLRSGDEVEIAYLSDGVEATAPKTSSVSEVASDVHAELERIRAELEQHAVEVANYSPQPFQMWTKAPRPRMLKVWTNSGGSVDADLGDEEQLQAVLNFVRGSCELEVDALTVLDDGRTKGKRWIQQQLSAGDELKISYVS
jgi:hypothetical protein